MRTLVIEDERLRRCSYISRSGEAKKAMKESSFLSADVISGHGEICHSKKWNRSTYCKKTDDRV